MRLPYVGIGRVDIGDPRSIGPPQLSSGYWAAIHSHGQLGLFDHGGSQKPPLSVDPADYVWRLSCVGKDR